MNETYTASVNEVVAILVVLLGLAFGSFLNVCISRLPLHESIVAPRSRCPLCRAPIAALDNIPLLSFALLRGRCRHCGARISWRYPLVELATATLFLLCYLEFGITVAGAGMAVFCFLLLGLAAMDVETLTLPDAFTLPGIGLGLLDSALLCGGAWRDELRCAAVALGWAAAAAAAMLAIRGLYWLVRRREGMGLGDAKLFAMIAAWLGPGNSLLALFLAVIAGAMYGIISATGVFRGNRGRARAGSATVPAQEPVPLGYFLCAAAIFAVFEGNAVIGWYLRFFR